MPRQLDKSYAFTGEGQSNGLSTITLWVWPHMLIHGALWQRGWSGRTRDYSYFVSLGLADLVN